MKHTNALKHPTLLQAILFLTTILLCITLTTAQANEWSINALMALLAQNKGGEAHFTEKKYIHELDKPLTAKGTLIYKAPNHLEKRTTTPKPESFVLDGDTVSIEHGGKTFTVQLSDYPKIAAFIESIRGTLAGDRHALERSYHLNLNGTQKQWTLTLWPTDQQIIELVRNIHVHGHSGEVVSIEINQVDGDRSIMTIEKIGTS